MPIDVRMLPLSWVLNASRFLPPCLDGCAIYIPRSSTFTNYLWSCLWLQRLESFHRNSKEPLLYLLSIPHSIFGSPAFSSKFIALQHRVSHQRHRPNWHWKPMGSRATLHSSKPGLKRCVLCQILHSCFECIYNLIRFRIPCFTILLGKLCWTVIEGLVQPPI